MRGLPGCRDHPGPSRELFWQNDQQPTTAKLLFFFAHVAPQLIGLDIADLARINPGQGLARHFLLDPVDDRVMADAHQALRRPEPHPLGVMAQGAFLDLAGHQASIHVAKRCAAAFASVALVSVTTAPVFDQLIALAVSA